MGSGTSRTGNQVENIDIASASTSGSGSGGKLKKPRPSSSSSSSSTQQSRFKKTTDNEEIQRKSILPDIKLNNEDKDDSYIDKKVNRSKSASKSKIKRR